MKGGYSAKVWVRLGWIVETRIQKCNRDKNTPQRLKVGTLHQEDGRVEADMHVPQTLGLQHDFPVELKRIDP